MSEIKNIQENILTHLLFLREQDDGIRFSLRKTNREGRLNDGYWFHGNENYAAISFWRGNDWKNRTPNISFIVLANGDTSLEVNVSDSEYKRTFVELYLQRQIGLQGEGRRFWKPYGRKDYIAALDEFLREDKLVIDEIISTMQFFFEGKNEDDAIGFIDTIEFETALAKTMRYRYDLISEMQHADYSSLRSIQINSFGPIEHTGMFDIPENTQWIFITGENGTGKTTILRAIATILGDDLGDLKYLSLTEQSSIRVGVYTGENSPALYVEEELFFYHFPPGKKWLMVTGFAAYGASRLTNLTLNNKSIKNLEKRSTSLYNLTHTDGVLFDLLHKYDQWKLSIPLNILNIRFENIRVSLQDVIPNLNKITFGFDETPRVTRYFEHDDNGNEHEPVLFHQLASGIRSMVAMFGDMLCRLFDQQPEKTDPAELTGVVLIDEIDLHLHPRLQKKLVEQLSKTFQKIQFIVSTHSPIPMLGASQRSMFFNVRRRRESGVEIIDLSDINVLKMLPTAILTSDLFNMDTLFTRDGIPENMIRTEERYEDIVINDAVREDLKKIAAQLNNNNESSQ